MGNTPLVTVAAAAAADVRVSVCHGSVYVRKGRRPRSKIIIKLVRMLAELGRELVVVVIAVAAAAAAEQQPLGGKLYVRKGVRHIATQSEE